MTGDHLLEIPEIKSQSNAKQSSVPCHWEQMWGEAWRNSIDWGSVLPSIIGIRDQLGLTEGRMTNTSLFRLFTCLQIEQPILLLGCRTFGSFSTCRASFSEQRSTRGVLCASPFLSSLLFWREPLGLSKLIKGTSRWHWKGTSSLNDMFQEIPLVPWCTLERHYE